MPKTILTLSFVIFLLLFTDFFHNKQEVLAISERLTATVIYVEVPQDFQLFPRLVATNMALIRIRGRLETPEHVEIIARLFQGSVGSTAVGRCNMADESTSYAVSRQTLSYSEGAAAFDLSLPFESLLSNYQLEICLRDDLGETLERQVVDLVAGDVFLVHGQSNANAEIRPGSSSANGNQSDFVRSFGYRETSFNPDTETSSAVSNLQNNARWYRAEGDARNGPGAVGQWGLRLGRKIVDEIGVPVAILNNAVSSTTIEQHQRDDADPDRLTGFRSGGIYGRLLWRAQKANVAQSVRAMLWYQGESDDGIGAGYLADFKALYTDWLIDYPGLEKVYVHQIRNIDGLCGSHDPLLREAQRSLADDPQLPLVSILSTTGIDPQIDACHFPYVNGYETIANNLFRLMARDLYGVAEPGGNVEAPNVDYAYFSNGNRQQVTMVMRAQNDTLFWNSGEDPSLGPEIDFGFSNPGLIVASGRAEGAELVVELNQAALQESRIHYFGHPGVNAPMVDSRVGDWIVNANGVGLLAFYDLPIAEDRPTVNLLTPNTPLSVSRQSPVAIAFLANDIDGIATIRVWAGDELINELNYIGGTGTPSTISEEIAWLPTTLGSQPIRIQAIDRRRASAQTIPLSVDVINQLPTVSLLSPEADNQFVQGDGAILLAANPVDADGGIAALSFWLNDAELATLSTEPWEYTWTDPPVGQHTLYAQSIDLDGGNALSASVSFTVLSPTTVPTAAPTAIPTATIVPTENPTATPTETPTESLTVSPTPLNTATPLPSALQIQPTAGAPASYFVLSGTRMMPNSQLPLLVNQSEIGRVQVDSEGAFTIQLSTAEGTAPGNYLVEIGEAQITYQIDNSAELAGPHGQLVEILVPRGSDGEETIFVPLIVGP